VDHGPNDPQPELVHPGRVSPWYQGITVDHLYPHCPARVRALPELTREGIALPRHTGLNPNGTDVCGWCTNLWNHRHPK
jgi:hypothetical protein